MVLAGHGGTYPAGERLSGMVLVGKSPPRAHVFQHLVPTWWHCFGRFSDLLGGGTSLEELGHCRGRGRVYSLALLSSRSLLPT